MMSCSQNSFPTTPGAVAESPVVAVPVAAATPSELPPSLAPVSPTEEPVSSGVIQYPIEFLLQFRSICDRVPCELPAVVKDTSVKKRLGEMSKKGGGVVVYTVVELLQFQHLYHALPPDLECTETVLTSSATARQSAKAAQKARLKEKRQQQLLRYPSLQYDPTLMCYFNPAEYAAGINMGVFSSSPHRANGSPANGTVAVASTGTSASATATGASASASASAGASAGAGSLSTTTPAVDPNTPNQPLAGVDVAQEAKEAETKLNKLFKSLNEWDVTQLLESFQTIPISCLETLQLVIDLLFDRALGDPTRSELFAQLLVGVSEKTPEFKDGAKTINFRRILLTKCYETLVEEPAELSSASPGARSSGAPKTGATSSLPIHHPHAWRRQHMLQNVGLIGELFRRQLLTENLMHVCIAMMLDDDEELHVEIVDAACQLISLVGDLLDGSSPASRRTMDEYFQVFSRLCEHSAMPSLLKSRIDELQETRTAGWIKKRLEGSGSTSTSTATSTRVEPT